LIGMDAELVARTRSQSNEQRQVCRALKLKRLPMHREKARVAVWIENHVLTVAALAIIQDERRVGL